MSCHARVFRSLAATLALGAACRGDPDDARAEFASHRGAAVLDASAYPTLQAAVDAAAAGDVVSVPAGDYPQGLVRLKDGVEIRGAGPASTTLHGGFLFDGAFRGGPGVVVAGFRITGVGSPAALDAGIQILRGSAVVRGNVVEDHGGHGIALTRGASGSVEGNVVRRNAIGVSTSEVGGPVRIVDNVVAFNASAGVKAFFGGAPDILHNTAVGNGFRSTPGGGGSGIAVGSDHGTVHNNVVVSNNGGLGIMVSGPTASHNLVWGNAVDYPRGGPGPGDLALDPLFADAAGGDFRLRAGSPAVDAGTSAHSTAADLEGRARPQGAAPDLGAFEYAAPVAVQVLVISEVMANPIDEDRGEFVELYNAGPAEVDLAGLRLSDGDAVDVIAQYAGGTTTMAPGAYAVVVDPQYPGVYAIAPGVTTVTVGNATLGNGLSTRDPVTLYEADGTTVLATYANPFDPGNGVSAERVDLAGRDVRTNWRASPCMHSAGRANCAPATFSAGLVISEVMNNPLDEQRGEFVELYNGTEGPLDAAGMRLSDGDATDAVAGWAGGATLVPAGSYAVVLDPDWPADRIALEVDPSAVLLTVADGTLGSGLAVDDPIALLDASGAVADTYTRNLRVADGRSVEKISLSLGDTAGNWVQSPCASGSSPGRLNCVSSASTGARKPLVITEVMTNPLDEDRGEFVELLNRGTDPVDAAGLILSDGDAVDALVGWQGGPTVVPPGGYAIILDAEYAAGYDLPETAVKLATGDTTLGSGLALDDELRLYEPNGVVVVDTFRFPFNPGNGRSAERVDVRAFDTAANWKASTCATGASPGRDNCAAAPAGLPKTLRITEVMANQAGAEAGGAGEFVEILNAGERTVDLAGMRLEIGPEGGTTARDTLAARAGAPTLLAPGAFAVVLDPQYDERYRFPAGTVLATVGDASLGASGLATNHAVALYDADGITLLDRFRHPSDPGDGVSLHRIAATGPDDASNWAATACGASPGSASCPAAPDAVTYTSFWVDRYGDESGIYWYQGIGWPDWHDPICEFLIVCDGPYNRYAYRDNFPAPAAFDFRNPYAGHTVVFQERAGPTDDCGGVAGNCTAATFGVAPGAQTRVPASSLGYYFARTDGPSLNTLDWFGGDENLYWSIPPDGILAPFSVEVPAP